MLKLSWRQTVPLAFVCSVALANALGRLLPLDINSCLSDDAPHLPIVRLLGQGDLQFPTQITTDNTHLFVLDYLSNRAIHIFDLAYGHRQSSFGTRASMGGELDGPWSLGFTRPHRSRLSVFELSSQQMTSYGNNSEGHEAPVSIDLEVSTPLTAATWIGPDAIAGWASDRRTLVVFDGSGTLAGAIQAPTHHDHTPAERPLTHQAVITAHPSRPLVAVAYRYAAAIDIFDASTMRAVSVTSPVDADWPASKSELDRFAYTSLASTGRHLFALFSGRSTRRSGIRAPYGACVHIYAWSGQFVEEVALGGNFASIAVHPSGESLYGIRHDSVATVVAFDLSPMDSHY